MVYAHDTKNHLSAIQSLNTDPAIERYIVALLDQLKTYTSNCHSGNMMLDVIINKYVLDCELRNIQFTYYVRSCNLVHVEDIDLVAILGNLMDNALTAAETSVKRFVSLETTIRNGYSVVVISNSCDTAPSNYIQEHHNIILLGATGSGKTYLACALGMAAARRFYAVKYIRLPDLLVEFQIARGNGTIRKLMAQYKKYALLIIDEWLLYPLRETEARDLLEIVESRYKRNSTIFCSQFDIPGWPEKLSDPLLADAICDRIVHDAYTVVIGGKESMRKRKGLQDI